MKINTEDHVHDLTTYFKGVLEEMIDGGCTPELIHISIHSGKINDTKGVIHYNSGTNMWYTCVDSKGKVYTTAGPSHKVCVPGESVNCLIEELTDAKGRAEKLVDEILKKAEEEDIPYELIQEMLKASEVGLRKEAQALVDRTKEMMLHEAEMQGRNNYVMHTYNTSPEVRSHPIFTDFINGLIEEGVKIHKHDDYWMFSWED